ncbi:hypothetical protein A8M77_27750 [Variovorax sp. JS1663]|nr:hypothetical protein A8M77_27750 [Variovorax sp. JS1663]
MTGPRTPIYRFYNSRTNAHFYTMSAEERDMVMVRFPQFNYEGVGFTAYAAPQPGLNAVYRFYNVRTGTHFYTIGEAERDTVINTLAAVYVFDGPAWYAATGGDGSGIPMYRFYNASTGTHFYTISAQEEADVRARFPQFTPEGIGYYAWTETATVAPLQPAEPVDLSRVLGLWAIDPSGVGGDAGGDGGVGGSAGDGSPLRRVTVILKDATPLPVVPPNYTGAPPPDPEVARGTTDANGRFLLKFRTATIRPPLLLQVIDAGGNVLASTTAEQVPTGMAIRLNVNPLTDKIASDVLAPSAGSTDKRVVGSQLDLSRLATATSNLVESSKAALAVAGISDSSAFDPMRSIYELDGKGVDAVIESITHSREPTTGATQLRTKLTAAQTNADGSVTPSLITASTPLAPSAVATESSPALAFAKITAWMNEMNRCFALSSAARAADPECADADGSRLVSPGFRENGKDLAEAYRTLYSEADRSAVQGSTLSNPAILVNFPASSAPPESAATIVEFTVDQPRTGPLAGNVAGRVRYTTMMSFVTTTSPRAKAGNWILGGNQKRFDASIQPGYQYAFQWHLALWSFLPHTYESLLEIRVSPLRFDVATRSYVSADLRAARVKGPGLPSAGLVLSPTTAPGAGRFFTPHNKTGEITAGSMTNARTRPIFYLGIEKTADSQPTANPSWGAGSPDHADAPLTDYSSMQAYSRYTIEYFLTSNTTGTPDWVETARILAPVMPPKYLELLPHNKFAASSAFDPGLIAPPRCFFQFQWYPINGTAAPVDSVFVTDGARIINADVDAVSAQPPSTAAAGTSCADPNAIEIAGYAGMGFRQAGVGSTNARFRVYSTARFN